MIGYKKQGNYVRLSDEDVKVLIHHLMDEVSPELWSLDYEKEVFTAAKRNVQHITNTDMDEDLINVANGMLDLNTLELKPTTIA